MKFGIRTLFVAVLLVAVGITVHRQWQFNSRWGAIQSRMLHWESNLTRPEGMVETFSFSTYDEAINGKPRYSLMTAEPKWSETGARYFPIRTAEQRRQSSSSIYVLPPGVWVESVDQAIKQWNKLAFLRKQLDAHGSFEPWTGLEAEREPPRAELAFDLFRKSVMSLAPDSHDQPTPLPSPDLSQDHDNQLDED